MPEGPGGREVGRVSLRVLPDTSKFLPSLKKYAERVERTVAVRLSTTIDGSGLENDARRISERIERTVPNIKVPMQPVSDGFLRDAQARVAAASKALQANIPLTADGERLRRSVLTEVAELEATIARMELEVPLDVEEAARAKAELRARIAALQFEANRHAVEVPVTTGSGAMGGSGFLGISPAMLASLSGVAAVLTGSVLASLPAIVAGIAGPVAAIALGFQGIATAAQVAAPAFDAMKQAISNTFAAELAPVFATLAEILPQITPQFQAIAEALSGAFGGLAEQLASPEGIAALQGILQGIADAITILAPSIGPLTQAFLDIANTGMRAFVENAPALNDALTTMANLFTYLNDSGVIKLAVDAFAGFVIAGTIVAGAVGAILIALAAAEGAINKVRITVAKAIAAIILKFGEMVAGVAGAISSAVGDIGSLPERASAALGDLGSLLFDKGAALIQGFIDGIRSMLDAVGSAASAVAEKVKGFFPGSPVKEGPLTSWNGGGAGKRLGDMLADGLDASRSVVRSASSNLAGAVAVPTAQLVGAGVAPQMDSSSSAWRDPYLLANILTDSLRAAPPVVDTRDNARRVAQYRNTRKVL